MSKKPELRTPIMAGLVSNGACGINLSPKLYDLLLEECKYLSAINDLKRSNNFEELKKVPYRKLRVASALCALKDYKGILEIAKREQAETRFDSVEVIEENNTEEVKQITEQTNPETKLEDEKLDGE